MYLRSPKPMPDSSALQLIGQLAIMTHPTHLQHLQHLTKYGPYTMPSCGQPTDPQHAVHYLGDGREQTEERKKNARGKPKLWIIFWPILAKSTAKLYELSVILDSNSFNESLPKNKSLLKKYKKWKKCKESWKKKSGIFGSVRKSKGRRRRKKAQQ